MDNIIKLKILHKTNFYTKEPVKILRIEFFGYYTFYHLTFKKLLKDGRGGIFRKA